LQVEAQSAIGADNIGHKLLQKMGWKEGKGIGAKEDGRTAPVAAAGAGAAAAAAAAGMKQDTLGLGAQAHGAVEAGDDPFEQYRKRMMLGYK
jgi:splicing factor 4